MFTRTMETTSAMSNTAKVLNFRPLSTKPQLPRDAVADQIRQMIKSDDIPPVGTTGRELIIAERRAYYKNLMKADCPNLTATDWAILLTNAIV